VAFGFDDAGRVRQQVEHVGERRQLRDHGIAGFVAPGRGAVKMWPQYGELTGS
jgi:hypothetical protein